MNVGCPSCGASIEFRAGSSIVVVCPHCRFAIVRTDRDVRTIGKVADLAATRSPFRLGLRGRFRGLGFTFVGRQQLDHGQGPWDEWYVAFDDGRWGWIAEAQGRVYATFPEPPPGVTFAQLAVGVTIEIAGRAFVVAEKGLGRNVSCDGELPTGLTPGASTHYVDLSGQGGTFASLDYGRGEQNAPDEAYIGFVVTLEELGLADVAMPQASPHDVAAVVGAALRCPSCGGNLEIRAPGATRRIACPYCSALLDTSQGQLRWLEALDQTKSEPQIPIGNKGYLAPLLIGHPGAEISEPGRVTGGLSTEWTVIGYQKRGCEVEGVWYYWDEYLLYEEKHGFRFLTEQDGHWNLVSPVEVAEVEETPRGAEFRGRAFKKFSDVEAYVVRVLGEFYWEVRLREQASAQDFIEPDLGLVLSREYMRGDDGREEIQWSLGHYVDGAKLFAAFGVKGAPPIARGVGANQPSPARASARFVNLTAAVLVGLSLVTFMVLSATAHGTTPVATSIALPLPPPEKLEEPPPAEPGQPAPDPADVNNEPAWFSEPFEVAAPGQVEVSITSDVDNSWLWVGGALIHEASGTVKEFEVESSYYSGVEDGEAWSEGARTRSASVGASTPGTYVLRLQPQRDTPASCAKFGTRCATSMSAKVVVGEATLWPGLLALAVIALGPLFAFLRARSLEVARWNESNVGSPYASSSSDDD